MTCPYGHDDGAYVLGALGPAERSAYENHLSGCAACATSVSRLAPMPGLLGRVDPATLRSREESPARLPQLIEAVRRQRRRQARVRRWRLAAAVVVAVVLALAGGAVWLDTVAGDEPAAPQVAMQRVVRDVPVTAQVAVEPVAGGTQVWMACQYPAVYQSPPRIFRLVAVGEDGTSEQVGSWMAAPGDEMELTGMTRLTGADLVRLELRRADGTVLLVHTPGGS